jgi:DNA-binding transcriptional LysR family regulator
MIADLNDLAAFVAVARAGGFRDAARLTGASASNLSAAVRRLETRLGVRLLNRTTRSVAPTEAGGRMLERLTPALAEIDAALDNITASGDRPAGTLKLNVPSSVGRTVLPAIIAGFLTAYPEIRLELHLEDDLVDVLAAGYDAGIRYVERLEQDMVAVPIGPRQQRFATAAAPSYLAGRALPEHPRDLLDHACLRVRFESGSMPIWEYERDGEVVRVDPRGPLVVQPGGGSDVLVSAAIAGLGVISLFEDRLRPAIDEGALVPLLEPWWQTFSGPYLYFPGRRLLPAPLRAFVDFIKGWESR